MWHSWPWASCGSDQPNLRRLWPPGSGSHSECRAQQRHYPANHQVWSLILRTGSWRRLKFWYSELNKVACMPINIHSPSYNIPLTRYPKISNKKLHQWPNLRKTNFGMAILGLVGLAKRQVSLVFGVFWVSLGLFGLEHLKTEEQWFQNTNSLGSVNLKWLTLI